MWAKFNTIVGKPLRTVELDSDGEYVVFSFHDGSTARYGVEGDCCSSSWIEHLSVPKDVDGAVIQEVKDSEGADATPEQEAEARGRNGYVDVLYVYHTSFVTDKGEIILEYRNDSNGYYGGSLYGPLK